MARVETVTLPAGSKLHRLWIGDKVVKIYNNKKEAANVAASVNAGAITWRCWWD